MVERAMSFKANECQQLSLEDSFMNLTDRERKALKNHGRRFLLMKSIFNTLCTRQALKSSLFRIKL